MSPIKGLTGQLRMPRLGKIHLGVKKLSAKGVEYPVALDYFVCPPEVIKVFGEKPNCLPILIPTEDAEYWASQYYRSYSQTRGLICKGDGEKARRMLDAKTLEIAKKDTTKVIWEDIDCPGRECDMYKSKKCGEMMCLQFMLPDVPGVGVYQVDTGSRRSISNINGEAEVIKRLCGHISMLPLLLTLESGEIQNPETGKLQPHYFLHLRERSTLHALLADSQKSAFELLAPPVDESQAARDIEELWGDGTPPAKPEATTSRHDTSTTGTTEEQSGVIAPEAEKVVAKKAEDGGIKTSGQFMVCQTELGLTSGELKAYPKVLTLFNKKDYQGAYDLLVKLMKGEG